MKNPLNYLHAIIWLFIFTLVDITSYPLLVDNYLMKGLNGELFSMIFLLLSMTLVPTIMLIIAANREGRD